MSLLLVGSLVRGLKSSSVKNPNPTGESQSRYALLVQWLELLIVWSLVVVIDSRRHLFERFHRLRVLL